MPKTSKSGRKHRRSTAKAMRRMARRTTRRAARTMKSYSNKAGDWHGIKKWFSKRRKKTRKGSKPRVRRRKTSKIKSSHSPVIGSPVLTPRSQIGIPVKTIRPSGMVNTVYHGTRPMDEIRRKTIKDEIKRLSQPPPLARKLD